MRELLSVKIDNFFGKKKSQDTRWVFDRYLLGKTLMHKEKKEGILKKITITPLDAKTQNLGMTGYFSPNCHKPIFSENGYVTNQAGVGIGTLCNTLLIINLLY